MRLLLATAMVLASSSAFASSIVAIGSGHASGPSIVEKRCTDCPPIVEKNRSSTYKVPELANGTQKTDIVEINGEKKLVRTEVWFGGSPVIYVSKLPDWMAEEKAVAALHPQSNGSTENELATTASTGDGVDVESTTGALPKEIDGVSGITAAAMAPAPLAIDGFQLRVN
ncbi:hypothetical protein KX729_05775 [Rhizobium sp. XQZ8]|uniref:plant virulence effector HPE1-like domain-containing protein n=1 Tax=Rhizobium populisoli TaxID=2859785 RepID=UPI001CA5A15B|nr:plant virulence effector HPE1-like domain-containing protein [Rhizobium populisoli]MBW6420945.1 hypothetical protein [Rhizobium populisoli]